MPANPGKLEDQFTSLGPKQTKDSRELADAISNALLEKKGRDIVVLDVRELTTLTDYFIVCHGTSETQIRALAGNVIEHVREATGEKVWKKEGLEASRWVILDYVSVVVHVFSEEKREFYGIERMWNDAERTEISDD